MKKTIVMLFAFLICAVSVSAYKVSYEFWIINANGGLSYPVGEMSSFNDFGFNGAISARKALDTEVSVGGSVAFLQAPYKTLEDGTQPEKPFSATMMCADAAYSPYMPDFFIWPYLKGSVGFFMVKSLKQASGGGSEEFEETAFGFRLGGGANYILTNEIGLNAEALYNQVSLQGGTTNNYTFFTFNAGITIFLK